MSEEVNYQQFILEIYEILREDLQKKELSKKEKNVLADAIVLDERNEPILQILGQLYMRLEFWDRPANDVIIKGGMKTPVRKLYEELGKDKNITASQKFIPGVNGYRNITWSDALYGNRMTEDEGFIGGGYAIFDPSEKYKSMEERIAVPEDDVVKNAKSSFGKMAQMGCLIFVLVIAAIVLVGLALIMLLRN